MESNDILAELESSIEKKEELETNSDLLAEETTDLEQKDLAPLKALIEEEVLAEKEKEEVVIDPESLQQQEAAESLEEYIKGEGINNLEKENKFFGSFKFLIKYSLTSVLIFGLLLVSTNYSAYLSIIESNFFSENLVKNEQSLVNSVKASHIKEKIQSKEERVRQESIEDDGININDGDPHSIDKIISNTNKNIDLGIEITPYEDRIIIPKIGKNIPLVDVKGQRISGENELNDIFMKELEKGVVRYPGSAKPGEIGNSFLFGHSSNFPWIKGEYNEVFALLDKVEFDDEIIVYYGQKKHVYKVREKRVTKPGDVSLLKRSDNKSEISIMTCWPIGTTLNRLIVVGDLVE